MAIRSDRSVQSTDESRSVLLAGLDDTLARRVVATLNSLGLSFHRSSLPAIFDASSGLPSESLAVTLFAFVGDQGVLAEIEQLMAWSSRVGRRTAVVVLYSTGLWDIFAPRIGHDIARVVSLDAIERELRGAVSRLLGVAPRLRIQVPVRLAPSFGANDWGAAGTTEDLSTSGMFFRYPGRLAVGSRWRFAIAFPKPGSTIRGSARIVRAADDVREGGQAIGARFVSFAGSGRERLSALLTPRGT